MANSLSAKKRIRQNATHRTRNRVRRSQIKTQIRRFTDALSENNLERAEREFRAVCKKLDRISCTSTIHKNQASRRKSRLQKRLNALRSAQN